MCSLGVQLLMLLCAVSNLQSLMLPWATAGNAPTMMAWDDLAKVAPLWMNISLSIFNDPEASKEWGWVQEMYAFTIACYNAGVPRVDLHKKMMSQPPWDTSAAPRLD